MRRKPLILFFLLMPIFVAACVPHRTVWADDATYVEGFITQNTVWTLVDSPFTVSNNITINPGVTLTIEPGVDIRFGPGFSLVVNGRLIANGTPEKKIHFTSNKLAPNNGDWGTILFAGAEQSSIMNCVIEFGTNGVTLEDGQLTLQDSIVQSNSGNGTHIANGNIGILNSKIFNNTANGISIAGGTQVVIRNNIFESNGNGVILTGTLTGLISVEQNTITSSLQAGIVFASASHSNVVVTRNNISSNNNGFFVSTEAGTSITGNYISNNAVGIQYDSGSNHEAHFNDIFDNVLGIDVSNNATVRATQNYWGDRTGPKHDSLNPLGIGNPVGGKGVDLDFVFFLSLPIDHINMLPVATIWSDMILVTLNQNVTFIGTHSQDEGRVDQYLFDFGDGTNTGWTTLSLFNHSYGTTGTYVASVTIIDDFGAISQNAATTTINVQDLAPLNVQVTLSNETVSSGEEVSVSAYVWNELGPAQNANVKLFSVKGGTFTADTGITDSNGYFTSTFKTENVTKLEHVRIIARASIDGYADGADHKYLQILPLLNVHVTSEPTTVKSEERAMVTVEVTDTVGQPVSNAAITIFAENGTLSAYSGTTDSNGTATFNFTAPLTLAETQVIILARASLTTRDGPVRGEAYATIQIVPKIINVEVFAEPSATISDGRVNITVHTAYENESLAGTNVTLNAQEGNFAPTTRLTDEKGNAIFVYTAPRLNEQGNINITAVATLDRYVENSASYVMTVNPRTFSFQINALPPRFEMPANVSVYVTCREDGTFVEGATVTLTLDSGESITNTTDSAGFCTFTLDASHTRALGINMTFTFARDGYAESQTRIEVPVIQPEAGFPWVTVILIVIPVAIAVIVVVLAKLKVILISSREEE